MKIIITLITVLLVTACSSTGGKAVDKVYYRFPSVTTTPIDRKLYIAQPTAVGILGNRPMVAENINGGLLQMSHNFWLDSPKKLLHNYLHKVLVHTQDKKADRLLTKILHLEKKGTHSVLAIKFIILDADNKQIFNKTYQTEEALASNDIPTFVTSIANSLTNMIQQLLNDLP
ncbi:MAG: hypothetical protein L3J53_06055 [Proteobacteria bacterium]|nr:hypothetical protein [Pseudomonadota bacterium]